MNSSKRSDGEDESVVDERSLYKMLEERRAAGLPTSQPWTGPDVIRGNLEKANAIRRKVGLPLLPDVDEAEEGEGYREGGVDVVNKT